MAGLPKFLRLIMTNTERIAHKHRSLDHNQLRLGLPMWYMPQWRGELLTPVGDAQSALAEYARQFSSVEGNTTFYGLPTVERAQHWAQQVPESFRFAFKLPRSISHSHDLLQALKRELPAWLAFCQAVGSRLGLGLLQLPAQFGPERLPELFSALDALRQEQTVPLAVEVRHPALFAKGDAERQLLRELTQREVDRVIFDARGLFHDDGQSAEILDARAKKPRLPVHPIATGKHPVVRFIGHSQWQRDDEFLQQWHAKLIEWQQQGRQPFFFIHTAGNHNAPQRANAVCDAWHLPELKWQPTQPSLL